MVSASRVLVLCCCALLGWSIFVYDLSIVEQHKGSATHVNLEDGRRTLGPKSERQHGS